MSKNIDSNSDVQNEIERIMFGKIVQLLGIEDLERNPKLELECRNSYICPDFYSENRKIIGEIHVHIGKLKSAQVDKISSDVLKMIFYEKVQNTEYKKYIAVCDEKEYKQLVGNSFIAVAMREFNVKVLRIKLDYECSELINNAMNRQNLMNKR